MMRRALLLWGMGTAALTGCVGTSHEGAFRISAEEMNGAWGAVMARAGREAEAAGLSPLEDPLPPSYSAATCRWIEPGRKARCRYQVERGFVRPGQKRASVPEEGELYRTETGWDFGS